jgi:hypothetical protein
MERNSRYPGDMSPSGAYNADRASALSGVPVDDPRLVAARGPGARNPERRAAPRLTALAEVVAWMAEAQASLTHEELNAAQGEFAAERQPTKGAPRAEKSRTSTTRRRG